MGRKKVHHDEHVDETWLIPYADMLTLLLALFIVMFAISKVDNKKFKDMSEQFNVIFSGTSSVVDGGEGAIENFSPSGSQGTSLNTIEENTMKEIKKALDEKISGSSYSNKVKTSLNEGGLKISIQDAILFNSGDAGVLKEVEPLLLQISDMLRSLDNDVKIAGHSDNVPIHNSKFSSNWELSAMRAINVMNYMVGTGGINQGRVSVEAFADQRPEYNNETEEGRAKNRRVEIFIIRKYPKTDGKK